MVSDKINQWTLLVGMLPLAMSLGAGGLTALPLDARQHEEFLLTAAQSLWSRAAAAAAIEPHWRSSARRLVLRAGGYRTCVSR